MFTFTLLAETLTFISIQAGKPREANSAWHDPSYDVIDHGSCGLWALKFSDNTSKWETRRCTKFSVILPLNTRVISEKHMERGCITPVPARVKFCPLTYDGEATKLPDLRWQIYLQIYYLHFVGTHSTDDLIIFRQFHNFPSNIAVVKRLQNILYLVAWHDRVTWPCRHNLNFLHRLQSR